LIIIVCLFQLISNLDAFVFTESSYGDRIKWNTSAGIKLYYNSQNSSGISDGNITSAISSSVNSWNITSGMFTPTSTTTTVQNGRNEIYFSSNSAFFSGVGVVGVTQVSYREEDGEIVEADIILNDNYGFSDDPKDSNYIGNALTHELGHLLGLGHSQVKRSSMFYKLGIGQHQLETDDTHGLKKLYGISENTASISGKVIGGKSLFPVFGAHVQLFSITKGEFVAGQVADLNGQFSFTGLDSLDQYHIYVEPIKNLSSLHSYYSSVRKNYCQSFANYRGAFYTSCESSKRGLPVAIHFSKTLNVDVGNITIRCGLEVPTSYLSSRDSVFELKSETSNFSYSYVGYFTKKEIDDAKEDVVEIDLSGLSIPSSQYYLQINLVTHQLFSPLKLKLEAERNALIYDFDFDPVYENLHLDGSPNLDLSKKIQLSTVASQNIVTLTITPSDVNDYIADTGDFLIEDLFPSSLEYLDTSYFYLLTAHLVKYDSLSGTYSNVLLPTTDFRDNSFCPEAFSTYTTTPYTTTKSSLAQALKAKKEDSLLGGCGSMMLLGGHGGPPSSGQGGILAFLFGLIPLILIARKQTQVI
jgi:hypothetical protein